MDRAGSEFPSGIGEVVGVVGKTIRRDTQQRYAPSRTRTDPNERNQGAIIRAGTRSLSHLRTENRNELLPGIGNVAHIGTLCVLAFKQ